MILVLIIHRETRDTLRKFSCGVRQHKNTVEVEQQAFKHIPQHDNLRKLFWRRSRHPAAQSPRAMAATAPKNFP